MTVLVSYPGTRHSLNVQSSLRLHLVLGTSFLHHVPYPMMPYSKPGRVAKLMTMLIVWVCVRVRGCVFMYVCVCIWSTMPWYGLQQAGTRDVSSNINHAHFTHAGSNDHQQAHWKCIEQPFL